MATEPSYSQADLTTSRAPGVEDPVIEVEDASVTYSGGDTYVLDDISIEVDRHEVLGIVGESGSGKSMFASALLDAVPDPGTLSAEITYYPEDGSPIDVLELDDDELRQFRWDEISMVFQGAMSSFNPTMTIREHFEETLKAHDKRVPKGIEFAGELLEKDRKSVV